LCLTSFYHNPTREVRYQFDSSFSSLH
jgi:hypothetical protein